MAVIGSGKPEILTTLPPRRTTEKAPFNGVAADEIEGAGVVAKPAREVSFGVVGHDVRAEVRRTFRV